MVPSVTAVKHGIEPLEVSTAASRVAASASPGRRMGQAMKGAASYRSAWSRLLRCWPGHSRIAGLW